MQRNLCTIFLLFGFMLGGAEPLVAEPSVRVSLVTGSEYLPYTDPSLEGGGLVTVLVKQAFSASGLESSEVEFKPWARGLLETAAMTYDATFPYARTPEKEAKFYYSDVVAEVEESFFVSAAFAKESVEPASLQNKVVCRPVGYNLTMLETLKKSASFTIEAPVSLAQCFGMLERKRVDYVFISDLVGWYAIKNIQGMDRKKFKSLPVSSTHTKTGLHLLVSRNHPAATLILEKFNKGLSMLRINGEYDRITKKYIFEDATMGIKE